MKFLAGDIEKLAHRLKSDELVALPTETVYGLAGNAFSLAAVARIFSRKKRPARNPLIVHAAHKAAFLSEVVWNEKAEDLANRFWPGPLTLVLAKAVTSRVAGAVSAGQPTLACRVPAQKDTLALLSRLDFLLAMPSANQAGRLSPTSALAVERALGKDCWVLDSGTCSQGLESTILSLLGDKPEVLRPGSLSPNALESALGQKLKIAGTDKGGVLASPGRLEAHYATSKPLRTNARTPEKDEAFVILSADQGKNLLKSQIFCLSPSGNLEEAARHLYARLGEAERSDFERIAVATIPEEGPGLAINDRLRRAAAAWP